MVKFQYTEGNAIFEKEYYSLSAVYEELASGNDIILEEINTTTIWN